VAVSSLTFTTSTQWQLNAIGGEHDYGDGRSHHADASSAACLPPACENGHTAHLS